MDVFDKDALADHDALSARALELHAQGYNCAQCVACVLAPLVGVDADVAFRATEGFGGGMGCASETCGAVSGGVALFGLVNSAGIGAPTRKAATYGMSRELVTRFRDQVGATVCREIKTGVGGAPLRSCNGCILDALLITADVLGRTGA